MSFETAIERILGHDEHYSNHPDDPGRETCWGVTAKVAMQCGYTGPMSAMPRDTAKQIYKKRYWQEIHGDEMPDWLAFQVMDAAVNSGVEQAVLWLQRALDVEADGILGVKTLAAAQAADKLVATHFLGYRLKMLADLPTWPAYSRGWARRVASNLLSIE